MMSSKARLGAFVLFNIHPNNARSGINPQKAARRRQLTLDLLRDERGGSTKPDESMREGPRLQMSFLCLYLYPFRDQTDRPMRRKEPMTPRWKKCVRDEW